MGRFNRRKERVNYYRLVGLELRWGSIGNLRLFCVNEGGEDTVEVGGGREEIFSR